MIDAAQPLTAAVSMSPPHAAQVSGCVEENQREQIQTENFPTLATVTSLRPLSVTMSAQPFAAAVSVSLLHAARSRAAA